MDDGLTYAQAAERLNISAEAVRAKAIRDRWPRTIGGDGFARVRLPEGLVVKAMEVQIGTLKAQLAAAETRARTAELIAEQVTAAFATLAERLAPSAAQTLP